MSLSVAGVWQVGVWDQTVWAEGVWREGEYVAPEVPQATQPTGGWPEYGSWGNYRKRKRKTFRLEDPEEKKAAEVVREVVQAVAKDEPEEVKQTDIELAVRLALQNQQIAYRMIYLRIAEDELERLKQEHHEMMMDEEMIILLSV